ncbi:MAG: hypothetical protein K1X57_21070, partial [Gemmataceae bacterium]|nr:hypothetical protein [Gemmataceae bacterium]
LVKCLEDFETESIRSRAQGLVENRREWQEKYPVLVTACKGDGRVIEDTLFDMWRFVYLMPPSDEELAERFVKQYLAKDPLGDDD